VPGLAFFVPLLCGVAALVQLGLAAARASGGADDDRRAAGQHLILHGAAVLALLGCLLALADRATLGARIAGVVLLGLWGPTAIVTGVVVTRRSGRPGRSEPPEEDDGGGGGGRGDEPEPQPPWWPQFERDLAAWQDRERAAGPR
jgi:hypothetical protein